MTTTILTKQEAANHLERAWNEAERLTERFAQRSKDEKKRQAVLQELLPKLRRFAKGGALPKEGITAEQLALLQSLAPKA